MGGSFDLKWKLKVKISDKQNFCMFFLVSFTPEIMRFQFFYLNELPTDF